jgi:hypothetical protein
VGRVAFFAREYLESNYEDLLRGTFAPFFRASERPMAMACVLLLTTPPLPPFPDFRVPRFFLCRAVFTDLLAAFPYLAIGRLLIRSNYESQDHNNGRAASMPFLQ